MTFCIKAPNNYFHFLNNDSYLIRHLKMIFSNHIFIFAKNILNNIVIIEKFKGFFYKK